MAVLRTRFLGLPSPEPCLPVVFGSDRPRLRVNQLQFGNSSINRLERKKLRVSAVDRDSGGSGGGGGGGVDGSTDINRGSGNSSNSSNNNNNRKGSPSSSSSSSSNYVVPLDKSSCITRPLAEILRDLNKRIPDTMIKSTPHKDPDDALHSTFIPWYHANRMLSFYAPGWCGEVRDIIFSENGSVTVVYRVTIRGSDGEAHRESTGTVSSSGAQVVDPVAAAEEIAFCRACARFGLGLYLYHD